MTKQSVRQRQALSGSARAALHRKGRLRILRSTRPQMPLAGHIPRAFPGVAILALIFLGLVTLANRTHAQQVTTVIQFTNVWKYDQSGRELGTAWRTNDFDDSAWPSGAGLLGVEPDTPQVYAVHAPIRTPLTVSSSVTSFYFRTTFQFSGETNGLSLVASNLADEGCVIYLNGFEAGRLRVSANQNATTLATAGTEGQLDILNLNNVSRLRQGQNLLAVEVHQSTPSSGDIMWGMKLAAIQQLPLAITNPPQDQIVTVGDAVTFQVGVSGGPAYYQWQKGDINIPGAIGNPYTIGTAQLSHAGLYRVIVSNAVNTVTSSPALLSVFADTTGPRLLSAVVRETGVTNQIILTFSENVQSGFVANSSSTNILNYRVTRCGGIDDVVVTNAAAGGRQVQLRLGGPNWVIGDCYYVTVNNVTDARGNRIAPNSQVAVSWPRPVSVLHSSDRWRFHDSNIFEPGIADTNWYACDFIESSWWADGMPCFCFGLFGFTPCTEPSSSPIAFQPEPVLFRTWFHWPTNLPAEEATLRPRFAVDDGAVFYLNGVEIYRHNMPGGPLNSTSKAATIVGTPASVTNLNWSVTNLVSGSNCFAVAVYQAAGASGADTAFCFELDITYLLTPLLPSLPEPVLDIAPLDFAAVRLWWTGGGYALESATNLTDNPASYPFGPWQEVPAMSNPYTNSLAAPARFFRLKK